MLLPPKLFPIDDDDRLFISPTITDWSLVHDHGIEIIIDLEGDLDQGVSTRPGHLLYIYHHIYDEDLPDLVRMHALAVLGAHLIRNGQKVLAHCGMGFNRSALLGAHPHRARLQRRCRCRTAARKAARRGSTSGSPSTSRQ